jgi:hypothetical protein
MISKHCLECGVEAHPKLKHPLSFRTEVSIWAVAIIVGLVAGTWSAASSSSAPSLTSALPALSLSSTQPAEPPAQTVAPEESNTPGPGMGLALWVRYLVLDFLRTAWWVLPFPILFSIWRQRKKYPVCAACGSRKLIPVLAPHGKEPPLL